MRKITLWFVRGLSEKFELALDWLKKAGPYIVGAWVFIGVILILIKGSQAVIQSATRQGYSWFGWAGVFVFWIILIVAGTGKGGASSSGSEEKDMSDEQNRNST